VARRIVVATTVAGRAAEGLSESSKTRSTVVSQATRRPRTKLRSGGGFRGLRRGALAGLGLTMGHCTTAA
jgi:hypothetical protein